eukprot:TRINITY_DN6402_c0_g1_i2.p1 TRINITY_DN6402_c0_g1~~TRINITY_DN6402_c0_g1_i2.p1  ORF type:complete len:586 (+),score=97.35 TRINITY_DN6402_c0_g1_i2:47-1804(+)
MDPANDEQRGEDLDEILERPDKTLLDILCCEEVRDQAQYRPDPLMKFISEEQNPTILLKISLGFVMYQAPQSPTQRSQTVAKQGSLIKLEKVASSIRNFDDSSLIDARRIAYNAELLLTCGEPSVYNQVSEDNNLALLFAFLENPTRQSEYYCRSFSKIFVHLLTYNHQKVTAYLAANPKHVKNILDFKQNADIYETLIKLATLSLDGNGAQLLYDENFGERLLSDFISSVNATECDILSKTMRTFTDIAGRNNLVSILWEDCFRPPYIQKWFPKLFQMSGAKGVQALGIFREFITYFRERDSSLCDGISEDSFLSAIEGYIPKLTSIIRPRSGERACGFMRLEAAKIYKEFLMLRSDTLLTVLEENQVLNALWDAFTYFTSNNILHSTFVDMMFESYGTGNTSLDAYFHRSRVIEDILRLRKQLVVSKSKCLFRGHIDKLAEHIYIKLYQLPEHPYYWDSLVETFKDDIPDWIKGSPGKRMRAGRRNTVLETGDVADVGAAAVAVGYQLPSNPVQMPHLRELSNVDEDTDESDDGYDEDWYDPEKGSASADHGPPPRPPARVSAELRIAAGVGFLLQFFFHLLI